MVDPAPFAQSRDIIVEHRERIRHLLPLGQLVEPCEMREQQAGIEAPPPRHLLPVIIDRLVHPVDRPVGERRRRMVARRHQRRIPGERKAPLRPPRPIGRLRRNRRRPAGEPDIPEQLEMREKLRLPHGAEDGVALVSGRVGFGFGIGGSRSVVRVIGKGGVGDESGHGSPWMRVREPAQV